MRALGVYTPHGGNIRVSIYAYIRTISPTVPHRCIHSIMLSGETRLSRILKGFNNIWKLLPKSWRSSSSLRYVLGATLGIRPIHLPSPLRRRIPESLGRLWVPGGEDARDERGGPIISLPPAVPINYHLADTTHAPVALTFLLNRVRAGASCRSCD